MVHRVAKRKLEYAIEHAPPGLLKRIDRGVMVVWVCAEDTHREATQKTAQIGMLIKTPEGAAAQSPYMRIAARQGEIMLRAAALLGFSPASRAGVSAAVSAATRSTATAGGRCERRGRGQSRGRRQTRRDRARRPEFLRPNN